MEPYRVAQHGQEAALEPDLPIVDPHHHLWSVTPAPGFPTYSEEEVLNDKAHSGHNVVATIYVEAESHYRKDGPEHLRLVGETEYINRFADAADAQGGRMAGTCAGIIARANLSLGAAVVEQLAAHHEAAPRRLVGIRHRTSFDADIPSHSGPIAGEAMRPEFLEGLAQLAPAGLAFDAAFFQSQLDEPFDLAAALPGTKFIINHAGYPSAAGRYADAPEERFQDWRAKMERLAGLPNIFVKIGGLNMEFTGLAAPMDQRPPASSAVAERQRRYVLTAIDLFGPQRCMFESNFPVDKTGIAYSALWNAFKIITQDFGRDDRLDLFSRTASTVYGLSPAA